MWVDCKSSEERADRKQTRIPQLKGKLHLIKHPRRDWNSGLAKKKKEKHKTNSFPPFSGTAKSSSDENRGFSRKELSIIFLRTVVGLGERDGEMASGIEREMTKTNSERTFLWSLLPPPQRLQLLLICNFSPKPATFIGHAVLSCAVCR